MDPPGGLRGPDRCDGGDANLPRWDELNERWVMMSPWRSSMVGKGDVLNSLGCVWVWFVSVVHLLVELRVEGNWNLWRFRCDLGLSWVIGGRLVVWFGLGMHAGVYIHNPGINCI